MIPQAAQEFQKEQRDQTKETVEAVVRQWRRMGPNFDSSWSLIAGSLTAIIRMSQRETAVRARDYFTNVLEETGQPIDAAAGTPNIDAFVGLNGDGRSVEDALYGAVIRSKAGISGGGSVATSLMAGQKWATQASAFALADTVRSVNRVQFPSMKTQPGYVRLLTTPSCGRCAILAGRRYKSETPFPRHPRCDCQHIPAGEEVAGDMLFNAEDYFESLPTAEELAEKYPELTVKQRREKGILSQEDVFTNAGAEALRNGADINQVVNARRGMYTTVDGKTATREGITKRGTYGRTQRNFDKSSRSKYRQAANARLMPEQIQQMAGDDKGRYLNLLRYYGYIV